MENPYCSCKLTHALRRFCSCTAMTGYLICGFVFGEDSGGQVVTNMEAELAKKTEKSAEALAASTADGPADSAWVSIRTVGETAILLHRPLSFAGASSRDGEGVAAEWQSLVRRQWLELPVRSASYCCCTPLYL